MTLNVLGHVAFYAISGLACGWLAAFAFRRVVAFNERPIHQFLWSVLGCTLTGAALLLVLMTIGEVVFEFVVGRLVVIAARESETVGISKCSAKCCAALASRLDTA